MRITVLNRGGLAVIGGHYDPHADEAIVTARDGETVALTIEYPSAATAATITVAGMTATTANVSGLKLTATLSEIVDQSYADVQATVGGRVVMVRIRGRAPEADTY